MWRFTLFFLSLGCFLLGIIGDRVLSRRECGWLVGLAGVTGGIFLFIWSLPLLLSREVFSLAIYRFFGKVKWILSFDPLSLFFLAITSVVIIASSLFASSMMGRKREGRGEDACVSWVYFSIIISSIFVLTAGDVFSFLLAWEMMSIFIYLMVSCPSKSSPGYLMLAIGEAGTMAIMMAFLLLANHAGSLEFSTIAQGSTTLSPAIRWWVFILSFVGFGIKAGLVPLNFWLPRAYSASPRAFIPFIAGATLNLGLYGIIRVNASLLFPIGVGPGLVVLLTGAITALVGVLYASIEDDFKRLLAHSSIENAGIITIGVGAGLIFLSLGHPSFASISFIASLYHLLNHSIFKPLLFMGASEVEGSKGLRSLDEMGGILKKMPYTGLFVLVGVLSISAMPPFNGFISEWLTLEGLLRSVEVHPLGVRLAFVLAGVLLALTAGLAVTCFVRLFSMAFLGRARSSHVQVLREKRGVDMMAMALLALMCFVLGVAPTYVIPVLDRVVSPICGTGSSPYLVPAFFHSPGNSHLPLAFFHDFEKIGARIGHSILPGRGLVILHRGGNINPVVFVASPAYMLVTILVIVLFAMVITEIFPLRGRRIERSPVWAGGIKRLFSEMTYTASGFAQPIRVIFEALLRPRHVEERESLAGHFQMRIRRESVHIHLMDRFVLYPLVKGPSYLSAKLAKMHGGEVNTYTAYVFVVLVGVMLCLGFSFF